MVGPEDDDGVVSVRAGVEGIQDASDLGVGVAHAGQITVKSFLHGSELDQALVDS